MKVNSDIFTILTLSFSSIRKLLLDLTKAHLEHRQHVQYVPIAASYFPLSRPKSSEIHHPLLGALLHHELVDLEGGFFDGEDELIGLALNRVDLAVLEGDAVDQLHDGPLDQHQQVGRLETKTPAATSELVDDLGEKVEVEVQIAVDVLIVEGVLVVPDELVDVDEVVLDEGVQLVDDLQVVDVL